MPQFFLLFYAILQSWRPKEGHGPMASLKIRPWTWRFSGMPQHKSLVGNPRHTDLIRSAQEKYPACDLFANFKNF